MVSVVEQAARPFAVAAIWFDRSIMAAPSMLRMIAKGLMPSLLSAACHPAAARLAGPENGYLLMDGGGLSTGIKDRFVKLAGGPEVSVVLIPTALPDHAFDWEQERRSFSRAFGVEHVTILHTRDRQRADAADFVEPLRHASGVWIGGGRQWRLVDAYLGTAVEREIKALLARGGVVGGTSAGATIQGSFLVRGDPANATNSEGDNTIMMVPGHETGFGLLAQSAIDQHVITRHRESDLDQVIARHPDLLGIGIDEGAAIVVHGNSFEVMNGKVLIHDGRTHDGKLYYYLEPGGRFDLKTRIAEVRASAGGP
jgi:cyanophycinase